MKAPKNFYNTVDQSKLGIDDLFRRTAENEADIVALENAVADIEAKDELKSVKYFRVVMNRTSGDSFHVNGFRLHSGAMGEDFTFPGGSTVSASVAIPNIQLLIQNETREVGVWHVENLYPFNIDFYVPGGVDLSVYNDVQFLGGYYADTFPQSAKLLISEDGTTYKEVKSNDSIAYPGANNRVDFFGFDTDPVIEDIYDRIDDLETVVGDINGGLVKDVHDLQDDSRHYHDDIADLKTADTTINNRIDGHLLKETTTSADEGKIMSVDSNGDWELQNIPTQCATFIATYAWQTGTWTLTPEQCAQIISLYPTVPVFIKGSNYTLTVVDCNSSTIIASKVTCAAGYVNVWGVTIDTTTGTGTEELKTLH